MSDSRRERFNFWLAAARVTVICAMTVIGVIAAALVRIFLPKPKQLGPLLWCSRAWARAALRVMGIEARAEGPAPPPGAFIAPNHLGYLDPVALCAMCPMWFTPKAEVAQWPVVGPIVRLSGHPFVKRSRSRELAGMVDLLRARLESGFRVCVFLEGTSTGGDRVLPLKSALIEPALRVGAPIVPVGLVWSASDARIRIEENVAYWKPEHAFAPHLWRVMGLRGISLVARFGEPVVVQPDETRKELAERLRAEIARLAGVEAMPAERRGGSD